MSSAFGGGSSSQLFGSAGPGNFLTRGTGAIATLFMVTSISLALYSTEANMGSGGATEEVDKVLNEGGEGEGFGVEGGTTPASAPAELPPPAEAVPGPGELPTPIPVEGAPAPTGGASGSPAAPAGGAPTPGQ